MRQFLLLATMFGLLMAFNSASANSYKCAKMVVKDGWLKKYEYKGNTWGANTKKHGAVSSTVGSSTENTTSSVDPGVLIGNIMSSAQFTSSWGECSMLEMYIVKEFRDNYIEQNIAEIKKQIAVGQGHHVEALAYLSGCDNIKYSNWTDNLQSHMGEIYDVQDAQSFSLKIDEIIQADKSLRAQCQLPDNWG